jgi:hypothetical protein
MIMTDQMKSLLAEQNGILEDLLRLRDKMNDHTLDALNNRVEMLESMLAMEGYRG